MSIDVEEQYDKIYRYCYFKLHHQQTAEDITQETFLRYFQKYRCEKKDEPLKYLYTIARNLCIDEYRRQSSLQEVVCRKDFEHVCAEKHRFVQKDSMPGESMCHDMQENQILMKLTVRAVLSELQQEEQELLLLRYVNEVPVAAIGQIFGMSRFAVRRRLLTVEKKFRKLLEREGFT
ncbi:MAG: RNA polymerase sigma factor [Lachnospiraceae bacterium]|nr:RNA polymerase sigma factor [Lachnospiraceae bacterium]